jgi:beta-carotene hydroxylase
LWAAGFVPMWVGLIVNSIAAYAFYTVHHDATHKAISGRNSSWRWLDVVCGNIAGVALVLDFSAYGANHLRHHAHTNDAADPDLLVKGPLSQVPLKFGFSQVLLFLNALPSGNLFVPKLIDKLGIPLLAPTSAREKADASRLRRLYQASLILLAVAVPLGVFWPLFLLWWLPSRIGILVLMILFQWLPHFPFDRTDRFGATRITLWPGSTWLLAQQDRHLIHHLYPSIPWFRYRRAHRDLQAFLDGHDAIVQGSGTSPHVPIQLRTAS